jgi:hypothetical protein
MGHITARLDRFLLRSSFLDESFLPSSHILPWTGSDHMPITLNLPPPPPPNNFGLIPFIFNPLWISDSSFFDTIIEAWNCWIPGSPNYIWEQKLKRVKMTLKHWVKSPKEKEQEEKNRKIKEMDENILAMEDRPTTHSLLLKEQQDFIDYQKILHEEEETWRLKSRSLSLNSGDRNMRFFQRQTKARLWNNKVKDITKEYGTKIDDFHQIQAEAKLHFECLLTEEGIADLNIQEDLL